MIEWLDLTINLRYNAFFAFRCLFQISSIYELKRDK